MRKYGIAILVALASCVIVDGNLQVFENLKFNIKTGIIFKKNAIIDIPSGNYEAHISANSKSSVNVDLKLNGKKVSIPFQIPSGVEFPSTNGNLSLKSSQIKQPYDLTALVDTAREVSSRTDTVESCIYTTYETQCRWKCRDRDRDHDGDHERSFDRDHDRGGPRDCHQVCERVIVSHSGNQEVSYHYIYSTTKFDVSLLQPNTKSQVAKFEGKNYNTQKIYDHKGACY